MDNRTYWKRLILQKLMGLGILALCALIVWMCSNGKTPEDKDGTCLVFMIPTGIALLVTNKIVLEF